MHDPDREATYDADAERAMLALLDDEDVEQRRGAAYCLGDVKAPKVETLQALLRAAASDDEETGRSALHSVAQITGRYAPPPVAMLLEATRHDHPRVREAAVHGLGNLEKVPQADQTRCVDRLVELLGGGEASVRAAACENIGYFHGAREGAVPRLLALLDEDIDPRSREAVVQTLGNTYLNEDSAPPHVVERIRREVGHDHPKVAAIAKWAIACLERDRPAAPSKGEAETAAAPGPSAAEVEQRIREMEAYWAKTGRMFLAAILLLVAAIACAWLQPLGSVVLGAASGAAFVFWHNRKKASPTAKQRLQADLDLARAKLDELKAALDRRSGEKRDE